MKEFKDLTLTNGSLGFYNSKTVDNKSINFADKFGEAYILISTVMGGNYGVGDSYLVLDKNKWYLFIYYGDSSAGIKEVKTEQQVEDYLANQAKIYNQEGFFRRYI